MPRLTKFRVHFISVLKTEDPANRKSAIYKSADGKDFQFNIQIKHLRKDAKEGLIYGTVYEPDVKDTQDDWADADSIRDAAHSFLVEKRVNMVDVDHSYEPGSGTVVESFIKNGADSRFPDTKDGAWTVVIKLSAEAAKNIDEVKGLSMAGGGQYDTTAMEPKSSARVKKDGFKNKEAAPADATPEQLIQNLKDADQWPANYDDATGDDGDADDGVTMTQIFQAIQDNCDAKGITMSNGYGVLDALAAKLADAPPDDDDDTPASTPSSSTTKSSRIRPLKGLASGTRFRINSN